MVVTILGALVLDLSLKYAFHRPRPVPFFVPVPYTYSFPSGHSLFSFCFYGVLAGLLTRSIRSRMARVLIWTLAALLVAAIGLSRVYLGVHYPSDVIAGYLAASLWVSTLVALDRVRMEREECIQPRHLTFASASFGAQFPPFQTSSLSLVAYTVPARP